MFNFSGWVSEAWQIPPSTVEMGPPQKPYHPCMEYAFGTLTRYECLCYILGGFFKYVLCLPLGEDSHVDEHIFQMGWNHQAVLLLEWWFQGLLFHVLPFLPHCLVRKFIVFSAWNFQSPNIFFVILKSGCKVGPYTSYKWGYCINPISRVKEPQ